MTIVDELNRRLADGEVVVMDGGMGTELQARGIRMDGEAWAGLANLEHGDVVREIHEEFICAGADIIITNTFPANRFALAAAGYGDRVVEANRRAVEAALEARRRAADHAVVIAGSMSRFNLARATGQGLFGADGPDLLAVYREQASVLAHAGVDLIVLEMFDDGWGPAGRQAAVETGLPVWLGARVAVDTTGRLRVAITPDELRDDLGTALRTYDESSVSVVTVMHSELDTVLPALGVIGQHWLGPFGAYPHVGDWERPQWLFANITPEEFAGEAMRWVGVGAQLIGGCCGIRPAHIRALKEHVPLHVPDEVRRRRSA